MKTVLLVGSIIFDKNKILLLKRLDSKKFLPGYWDVPGGKLDPKEVLENAVIRETKEETGLDVQIIRPYNTWTCVVEFNNIKEYCVQIDFLVKAKKLGNIKLSDKEHSEYRWITKDSIPEKISLELRKTIEKAFDEIHKS